MLISVRTSDIDIVSYYKQLVCLSFLLTPISVR